MDEMKTTVRTLTFSTNYVSPSPFASKSGGHDPPSSYWSAAPGWCRSGLGLNWVGLDLWLRW